MRLILSVLVLAVAAVAIFSCKGNNDPGIATGEWYKEADFDGAWRSNAVTFTINGNPYIGGGFYTASSSTVGRFLNDFWVLDRAHNSWSQIASFPGTARSNGVAFSANGKGYYGLGTDGVNYYNDFWEYDPAQDKWTQVEKFPGTKRYGAVAFSISDIGYVGSGIDSAGNTKDFYAYDPTLNSWQRKAGIGTKRGNSFVFVIDGIAYVGGGINSGALDYTFYSYNPAEDIWHAEYDLQDDNKDQDANDKGYNMAHQQSATFVIDGKGYVVGGNKGSGPDASCWQYNPATRIWTVQTSMLNTSAPRDGAVGFTIDSFGYIATGRYGNQRLYDVWKFDPTAYHVN